MRAQLVIGATSVLYGFALLAVQRPPRWLLDASGIWGVVIISAVVAVADPSGRGDFFYLWPIVCLAYFSSRRVLMTAFTVLLTTFAIALLAHPENPRKVDTFLSTSVSVGLMGALVAGLTARETMLRAQLSEAASTDPLTGLLNHRYSFSGKIRANTR